MHIFFGKYFYSSVLRKIWQITVGGVFLACAAFLMLPLSFIRVATAVALGLNPPPLWVKYGRVIWANNGHSLVK